MRPASTFSVLLSLALAIPAVAQIPFARKIQIGRFPILAKLARMEGIVQVDLFIEGGRVKSYSIASGLPQLRNCLALSHIKDWQFSEDCPQAVSILVEFAYGPQLPEDTKWLQEMEYQEWIYPNRIRVVVPEPNPILSTHAPSPAKR